MKKLLMHKYPTIQTTAKKNFYAQHTDVVQAGIMDTIF